MQPITSLMEGKDMKKLALYVVMLSLIACHSATNKQAVVYYDGKWQANQDKKLAFCYQRAPTMELVVECLIALDVFI